MIQSIFCHRYPCFDILYRILDMFLDIFQWSLHCNICDNTFYKAALVFVVRIVHKFRRLQCQNISAALYADILTVGIFLVGSVMKCKCNSMQPKRGHHLEKRSRRPTWHTHLHIRFQIPLKSMFRNLRIYSSLKRAWMTNPTPPANPWSSNPTLFLSAPPWLAWAAEPWSTPCCRGSWMPCGLHSTVCPLCTSWAGQWAGQW